MEDITTEDKKFCECGCGEEVGKLWYWYKRERIIKRFKHGHNPAGPMKGSHPNPKYEFKKGQWAGDKHPRWKGGSKMDLMGYILRHKPHHRNCNSKGYVYEHRLVMEEYLGRYLTNDEIVHHINGDKADNRIENLEIMTASEHARHHYQHGKAHLRNQSTN